MVARTRLNVTVQYVACLAVPLLVLIPKKLLTTFVLELRPLPLTIRRMVNEHGESVK